MVQGFGVVYLITSIILHLMTLARFRSFSAKLEPQARKFCSQTEKDKDMHNWVLVTESSLSYHSKATVLFTIDLCFGNLSYIRLRERRQGPEV